MSKAEHCDYKEDCFYRLKYRGKTSQSENSQMKKMSTRKQSVFIEKVFSSVYNNPCTQAICVRSPIQKSILGSVPQIHAKFNCQGVEHCCARQITADLGAIFQLSDRPLSTSLLGDMRRLFEAAGLEVKCKDEEK